jgi:dTDP-4-dehydrorhamnose reductase
VNAVGSGLLAAAALQSNTGVCHISTDHVFHGSIIGTVPPYRPDDVRSPINHYGTTKMHGERFIEALPWHKHLIIRTSWLFGGRDDFLRTVLSRAKEHGALQVTQDQMACPTYARDLARAIPKLIANTSVRGNIHWTNEGSCSRSEWVLQALLSAGIEATVERVDFGHFGEVARRPVNSSLINSDYKVYETAPNRSWSEAVDEYVRGLVADGAI